MKIKAQTVRPRWFKGFVNKSNMAHYAKNNPNNTDVLKSEVVKWRNLCYMLLGFLCIQSALLLAYIIMETVK